MKSTLKSLFSLHRATPEVLGTNYAQVDYSVYYCGKELPQSNAHCVFCLITFLKQ